MSELPEDFDPDNVAIAEPEDNTPSPEAEEPEQAPRAEQADAPARFSYNDRFYALGIAGSGKSELLNVMFSGLACQRILLDTKPEFSIADVDPVHTPESIDWTAPLIHYQPAPGSDYTQYETIFGVLIQLRGVVVCAHEFAALVDYHPGKAGPNLIRYISQGRALGQGCLFGGQRPRLIPTAGLTEANHVVTFVPQLSRRDDLVAAAEALSPVDGQALSVNEFVHELAILQAEHGKHAFLWKDRYRGTLQAFQPLPDSVRHLSIVRRLEDA